MDIREYLYKKRMTLTSFCKLLDLTLTHMSGYINGRIRLSKKVARNIEKITEGKITAKEIMKGNPLKNKIYKK